jgi:PP-loop superfamily ATP-utilizing enzyme
MKFCSLQVNDKLENIILNEVSQAQKPKAACFLSYVEYRPNTNTEILRKIGHAKGRSHMGGRVKEGG